MCFYKVRTVSFLERGGMQATRSVTLRVGVCMWKGTHWALSHTSLSLHIHTHTHTQTYTLTHIHKHSYTHAVWEPACIGQRPRRSAVKTHAVTHYCAPSPSLPPSLLWVHPRKYKKMGDLYNQRTFLQPQPYWSNFFNYCSTWCL